jgi:hypothetical protein
LKSLPKRKKPSPLLPLTPKVLLQQKLKIKKPKLLRSNPLRKSLLANGNTSGFLIDDEDIYIGFRPPQLERKNSQFEDDEDISEYAKLRLFIARQLALEAAARYQKTA